ncbi:MAG: FtsX-like permease family protein [Oscillospiraceae bacterium]|nr:FtsX-like permease family protein [Oscillospiraceae bacterium]
MKKRGLYRRLAMNGIKGNRQLYIPHILACIGMVMLYFIVTSLSESDVIRLMSGGDSAQMLLELGKGVIALFAAIFLFYTNSFLMKRRQKEFGLYNVLGMSKHNIARILIWEHVFTAGTAIVGGIVLGIILYKLAELVLVHLISGDVTFTIELAWQAIPETALLFAIIFLLLFVFSLLKIRLTNPIELLKSESMGEKPPKANWFFGLLGAVILGFGYYLALTLESPMEMMMGFLLAAVLVMIGTYMLFMSGSVLMCKIMQKSKRYYYKPNHFVSVSSMTYRMKRNGAGLASICILLTAVLVMLSSTSSIMMGIEDILEDFYPRDLIVQFGTHKEVTDEQKEIVKNLAIDDDLDIQNVLEYEYIMTNGIFTDGNLALDYLYTDDDYVEVCVFDIDTYNRLNDSSETLGSGEVLLYSESGNMSEIYIDKLGTFAVKSEIEYPSFCPLQRTVYGMLVIVVDNLDVFNPIFETLGDKGNEIYIYRMWWYGFDVPGLSESEQSYYYGTHRTPLLKETLGLYNTGINYHISWDSLARNRSNYYGLFGGLLFLGIFLSLMFVLSAVLIIYYKQISEGYEDASRFEIMQKVGMTKADIKKSINSQMLSVFLLPVLMAAVHIAFASPIMLNLLKMCGFMNTWLFLGVTAACLAVVVVVYTVVYKITSEAYFRIVSAE